MILLALDRTERAATADVLSGSAKRSWRTVKPARRYAPTLVIDERGELRTDDTAGFNRDDGGKHASKVGMQRTAGIREICAVVMMRRNMIMDMSIMVGVLTIGVSDY